ncbi:MAG: Lrp/AsnC ligand binding domain-containing protein [Burkholderiaceae bacterium]
MKAYDRFLQERPVQAKAASIRTNVVLREVKYAETVSPLPSARRPAMDLLDHLRTLARAERLANLRLATVRFGATPTSTRHARGLLPGPGADAESHPRGGHLRHRRPARRGRHAGSGSTASSIASLAEWALRWRPPATSADRLRDALMRRHRQDGDGPRRPCGSQRRRARLGAPVHAPDPPPRPGACDALQHRIASITGEADYVIKVVVPDMKAYDRFLQERLFRLKGVASIRTNVVLREVKYETALPLPPG